MAFEIDCRKLSLKLYPQVRINVDEQFVATMTNIVVSICFFVRNFYYKILTDICKLFVNKYTSLENETHSFLFENKRYHSRRGRRTVFICEKFFHSSHVKRHFH